MTIDEAIEKYRNRVKQYKDWDNMKDIAEEHEQLAEWLEELQNLKAENTYLHDEMQAIGATMGLIEKEIRNKAIDEFAERIKDSKSYIFDDSFGYVIPISEIDEIAQQLKDGGTDG